MTTAVPIPVASSGPTKDMFSRPAGGNTGPKHKNQIEYEKKMSELDGRIGYLKARLDELKGGYSGANEGGAESGSPRAKIIGELKALREESRPLQDERKAWAKEAADLRDSIKKRGGELKDAKDKLPFKSIPEIEARIAEYEHQLETGSFRLAEEKQIVMEISKLKKAKKALLVLEAPVAGKSQDLGSMKARVDVLQEKIKARDGQLDGLRAKIDGLSAKLDEMNGTRATERVSKEERQAQFTKLRADLDEAYEARRKAYEENKVQRAAAYEARLKRDARFKEEARCAEIEERIADLEERIASHNPESLLDKKLAECNNMISFFSSLSGSGAGKAAPTEVAESKLAAPVGRTVTATEEIAKLEVVKKDEDDVYFLGGSGKSKTKKGPKTTTSSSSTQSSSDIGKLPMHVLAGLADLNISIPSASEQLPILLDALNQIKAALEGKKAELEADGAEQPLDPKTKALMDQLAALKLELDKKPEPVAE